MLNLLHRISCFMSSLEKPYVVDNSALTGREVASVSHIPSAGSGMGPRHSTHPVWVPEAASGLIAMQVIVPHAVYPMLPWTVE